MDKNTINILIIEDSKTDALLIKEAFKTIEYIIFNIEHIYNGNDINTQLNNFTPHIILLDLDLPGKHGLQILQEILQEYLLVMFIVQQTPLMANTFILMIY